MLSAALVPPRPVLDGGRRALHMKPRDGKVLACRSAFMHDGQAARRRMLVSQYAQRRAETFGAPMDLINVQAGIDTSSHAPLQIALPAVAAVGDRADRDAELAELLHAAAAGDTGAFEAFYNRTVGFAHSLARRMVRPADLDDVLADAFFQAWREAARFDAQRGSAVTWLLTLVRSRALDRLRQQRSAAAEDIEAVAERPSDLPGPDELLAMARAGSQLHAALASLSTNQRWVLGLAYFRELSHQQIADCTGLPLGSVKSLIQRSQIKLRGQLEPR